MIYHITTKKAWEEAEKTTGVYESPSLKTSGFIYCAKVEQIIGVANHLFKGQKGLVIVELDEGYLQPYEIKHEGIGVDKYPHVYGPIKTQAKVRVFDFLPDENGYFNLPLGL